MLGALIAMTGLTGLSATERAMAPAAATEVAIHSEGNFVPLPNARLVDTRSGLGLPAGKLHAQQTVPVTVLGQLGIPALDVSAVALNITTANSTVESWVTTWPSGGSPSGTTNHFTSLEGPLSNMAVVAPGSDGMVNFVLGGGESDLLINVIGYFTPSSQVGFQVTAATRVLDTRSGNGVPIGKVPARGTITFTMSDVPADAQSVFANVTTVASSDGHLNAGLSGSNRTTSERRRSRQ